MKKLSIILLAATLLLSCNKMKTDIPPEKETKQKVHIGKARPGVDYTYKDVLFNRYAIGYKTKIVEKRNNLVRTLLHFIDQKQYMYVLEEMRLPDSAWTAMCIISKTPITNDLFRFTIRPGIVWSADKSKQVFAFKLGSGAVHNLNELADVQTTTFCTEGQWLVWVDDAGVTIAEWEDGWCVSFPGGSGGSIGGGWGGTPASPGGGGSGTGTAAPNPVTPVENRLPSLSYGNEVIANSSGQELHDITVSASLVQDGVQQKKAVNVKWDFYDMHVFGGNHVIYYVSFGGIIFKEANKWLWESFVENGKGRSTGPTLGGYPPCIEDVYNISTSSFISDDKRKATATVSMNLTMKVTCLGGMAIGNWSVDNLTSDFLAANY